MNNESDMLVSAEEAREIRDGKGGALFPMVHRLCATVIHLRLHTVLALEAERDALRAIVEGRTTAPTAREVESLMTRDRPWSRWLVLVRHGQLEPILHSVSLRYDRESRVIFADSAGGDWDPNTLDDVCAVRWWRIDDSDESGGLRAWPVVAGGPVPPAEPLDLDAIRALNNDLRGDDTHPAPMSDRRLASIASNAHECDYDDFAEVIVEAARARAEVTRLRAIEAAARASFDAEAAFDAATLNGIADDGVDEARAWRARVNAARTVAETARATLAGLLAGEVTAAGKAAGA